MFGRRLHLSLPISGRASRMTFALCRTAKESAGMQRAPPRTPVAVRGRTGMGRGRRGEVRGKKWNEIGARCALARRSRILLSLSLCLSVCLCLSLSPRCSWATGFLRGRVHRAALGRRCSGQSRRARWGSSGASPRMTGACLCFTTPSTGTKALQIAARRSLLFCTRAKHRITRFVVQHNTLPTGGRWGRTNQGELWCLSKDRQTRHDKPRKWNGMEAEDVTRRTAAA